MRDALNATGRPILFSLCGWKHWYGPVGGGLGNMWRISLDVIDWFGVYRSAMVGVCALRTSAISLKIAGI